MDIPSTWEIASLSQIAELNPRLDKSGCAGSTLVSFVPMRSVEAGTGAVDVSQTRSLNDVKKGFKPFRQGDVLFAKITPCMENGKVAVAPKLKNGLGFGSTEFHVLRPHSEMNSKYIYFFVSSDEFRNEAEHNMTGAVGQRRVPTSYLADRAIPVPPVVEQRRIVAETEELFSELDKGVHALKTARAQLSVYRQAVLKHAFEGKLTEQWRKKNKDQLESSEQVLARIEKERARWFQQKIHEWKVAVNRWEKEGGRGKKPLRPRDCKPVSSIIEGELASTDTSPSGWLKLTTQSIGNVQLGRQRSPKNRSKQYPTKYIRAANITDGGLDLSDVLDMEFHPHELKAYRLQKGDLLISEASGSAAQVGKPAIWDNQISNCCFQNTVIRHQPYCRDYADYLLWLYRYFFWSGKFAQIAGGVGINHLSASKFAKISIPICSPAEQQEIVHLLEERFVAIESQEKQIDSALTQVESLRQSILNRAFCGQLVPQDSSDEPASVLLERIKAERDESLADSNRSSAERSAA